MQYLYLIGCIILDWISFAAGANANAISIYLIGYSYTSLISCTTVTTLSDLSFAAEANAMQYLAILGRLYTI